jgi:hypothetical protein
MNKLKTRRSELELQISYQTSLLLGRFPNELLGEILLYFSGGRVDVCSPQSNSKKMEGRLPLGLLSMFSWRV